MQRFPILGFATLILCASAFAADGREHDSLQDLLARLRVNRDGVVNELRGSVEAQIATMDQEAVPRNLDALDNARKSLVALGPEAALLLVELVDPGTTSTDPQKLRSQYVTLALSELRSRAATTRLIEIAQSGSADGRLNAVQILGNSPDVERVGPVLVGIYRGNHGELRLAALIALARLGGDSNDKILDEGLSDAKPEVVDAALEALTQSKKASMAPRVLRLLAASSEAVRHQDRLMSYYRAVPETVDKATLMAWIRVAAELSATAEQRLKVLDFLPAFADRFDSDSKKELRLMSESPTKEVAQGALILLVVVGDKSARKELLAEYDDQIERNKTWPNSYAARGDVYYKIGDYKEAILDYKKAIQLSADDLKARQDTAYIGLARCYAMTKKIDEAGKTLEKAPLTKKQLAALKKDPAFARLVEHPKYKDLFSDK